MQLPESAADIDSAFRWKSYTVSKADKAPLLRFVVEALEARGCRLLHASGPERAPFYLVYETPGGTRQGLLAYAFLANTRTTRNRPPDEHRFQIKYGSELRGVLEVALDPHVLITTIFVGIDPEHDIFVAADPAMHDPSPMSRSVEFKRHHLEEIRDKGWITWERDRRPPKTTSRPTPTFDEDFRTEVLIGGRKDRLLDLIHLERLARGLEPGERHLLADKLLQRPFADHGAETSHALLAELGLPPEALFDLIDGASRLKMAVRGWVAEAHLQQALHTLPGVSECRRIEAEGQPDITLRWRNGPPILVECKNVLRKPPRNGLARIDFQRTRASKEDPCSRYYRAADFAVLAACMHAITEQWQFRFALTRELPAHRSCGGRIANNIIVDMPLFTARPESVFDKCSNPL